MKGLIITLLGIALFALGFIQVQNNFYGYTCCFLSGALIGIGLSKIINGK